MVFLLLLLPAAWVVLPLPVAMVVGRTLRGGQQAAPARSSFDLAA